MGNTDCALRLLDSTIDSAVVNLHAQPDKDEFQTVMSRAKAYRDVIPAQGPRAAAVQEALKAVPEPAPERQPSGLARLVAQSGRFSGESR